MLEDPMFGALFLGIRKGWSFLCWEASTVVGTVSLSLLSSERC